MKAELYTIVNYIYRQYQKHKTWSIYSFKEMIDKKVLRGAGWESVKIDIDFRNVQMQNPPYF